jgi:hypothetical protein
MMNFRLIGAAALSLMLATPAMAMHHGYHDHYGRVQKEVALQNALKFRYGSTYGAYNFYPRDEFAPDVDIDSLDFDRRNTFN